MERKLKQLNIVDYGKTQTNYNYTQFFHIACLCLDPIEYKEYTIIKLKRKRNMFIGKCKKCSTIYWFPI